VEARIVSAQDVIVIGGGLAGLAASVVLADSGLRVRLFEKAPRLGGRATTYLLPDGESIDNCQHVTLGCCTNLDDFYQRIGASGRIRYYDRLVFAGARGERSEIQPSILPAPLHLAPAFVAARFLNWQDKLGIARALYSVIRSAGKPVFAAPISMLVWLKQQRQTQQAIDRFWGIVLISALNEDLDRMDAAYGIAVFWKAFLSNRDGFSVGIPAVPLTELYILRNERIDVRTRSGVAQLLIEEGGVAGVRLDDGSEVRADHYVIATAFDRLSQMLPSGFADRDEFAGLRRLEVSPITSVHLWFDRQVMPELFLTALDRTIQWVFNKTKLSAAADSPASGEYLQIVISASHSLNEKSQKEIVDLCRRELAELIPETAGAEPTRCIVIRENSATFSPRPGCDRWRPDQRTSIRNLFIAGDWTQTGWPATMESAVRSGYLAAGGILEQRGRKAQFLLPELPVSRLARWLSRGG
jgi:squalene-associated FAD-dependent desaturase